MLTSSSPLFGSGAAGDGRGAVISHNIARNVAPATEGVARCGRSVVLRSCWWEFKRGFKFRFVTLPARGLARWRVGALVADAQRNGIRGNTQRSVVLAAKLFVSGL